MKLRYLLSYCLPILWLLACSNTDEDCSTVSCLGPPTLLFEVLLDGENVFETNTLALEDFSLSGNSPSNIELDIRETNFGNTTTSLLYLENASWEVQVYDFSLEIENYNPVNLVIEIRLSEGPCCGGIPRIESYTINGTPQASTGNVVTLELN